MSLAERLRRYLRPRPPAIALPLADGGPWRRPYVIMTAAGHRPTGLAGAMGDYRCACGQSSWSTHDDYGPYGGCVIGWHDAREFLSRYGVRNGVE